MKLSTPPHWLVKRFYNTEEFQEVKETLKRLNLRTVCEEALCPNLSECFSQKRLTFLILGTACTRNCSFCFVKKERKNLSWEEEVYNILQAVKYLEIKHLVLTSVTRDDLPDKGAGQFSRIIKNVKSIFLSTTVEALIPDFGGENSLIELVIKSGLDILNHNLETVPRLYPLVRPQADYGRSLKVLKIAKKFGSLTKSGLILGLGEKEEEVIKVMKDLNSIGVDILTLGQYLKPAKNKLEVREYITPEKFEFYKKFAWELGFKYILAGPFVRSSYLAEEILKEINKNSYAPRL
ncbi:MAG: lipoyl synthase [Candidatus Omnitrophica bacterium]|nr:lipoyl synthase [Candidatus Omnitrophota bacterium]